MAASLAAHRQPSTADRSRAGDRARAAADPEARAARDSSRRRFLTRRPTRCARQALILQLRLRLRRRRARDRASQAAAAAASLTLTAPRAATKRLESAALPRRLAAPKEAAVRVMSRSSNPLRCCYCCRLRCANRQARTYQTCDSESAACEWSAATSASEAAVAAISGSLVYLCLSRQRQRPRSCQTC